MHAGVIMSGEWISGVLCRAVSVSGRGLSPSAQVGHMVLHVESSVGLPRCARALEGQTRGSHSSWAEVFQELAEQMVTFWAEER